MMTALSQAEDKTRADKLGADRYLVKSQVTLEDVAKVARDVLAGESGNPTTGGSTTDTSVPSTPAPEPVVTPTPVVTAPEPSNAPTTDSTSVAAPEPVAEDESSAPMPVPSPAEPTEPEPETVPAPDSAPESTSTSAPEETSSEPEALSIPSDEEPAPSESGGIKSDLTQTTAQEEQAIENQISQIFAEPVTEEPDMVTTPAPGETIASPPPSVSPQSENTEPTPATTEQNVKTIEVADAPADAVIPEVTTPPTSDNEVAPEVVAPTSPAPVLEESITEAAPAEDSSSVPISGKRVIQPINDMSKGPDINDLLQKESDNAAVPPPPATSVVSPGGQTVVPVTTDVPADAKQPGNVISPNDIAL
jgi:hypothetical protein